jgi:rod shape-determining protein MreC
LLRSSPTLFNQGTPFLKLFFYLLLSIIIIFSDYKLHATEKIRLIGNNLLFPIQQVLALPSHYAHQTLNYFQTLSTLRTKSEKQSTEIENLQLMANQVEALETENSHLRKLLSLQQKTPYKNLTAEIIFNATNPTSQKVIVNRGSVDGVKTGMPVASFNGIIGQVVRVFENSSEVSLLEDKDFSIPVLVERNGLRAILFGVGRAEPLELRFVTNLADLDVGDYLMTSGIDGTYPAGIPVAIIAKIDRSSENAGAIISCKPLAKIDHFLHINILLFEPNSITPQPNEVEFSKNKARIKRGN